MALPAGYESSAETKGTRMLLPKMFGSFHLFPLFLRGGTGKGR